ncbi:MAG: hypothetical protein OHK0026_04630 [Rhodocyclaceae bacterium]
MPRYLLLALCSAALAPVAFAVEPFGATPQEKAMCDSTIGALRDRAAALTGTRPDAFHLHHYCDCLRFRQRALRNIGKKNDYRYNLGEAIGGCNYVLNHTGPDHGLRAMVLVDKGRALKLLGDTSAAAQSFTQAIQLEPRIPEPPYELALLLRDRGDKAGALEAATQGLRNNPGIKPLERLYLELGGKEPLPQPQVKAEPQAASQAATAAAPAAVGAGPAAGPASPAAPKENPPAPAAERRASAAAAPGRAPILGN